MDGGVFLKKNRLSEMKKLIMLEQKVSIKQLATMLNVSEITVRRDFQAIQQEMNLLLDRGFITFVNNDPPFNSRMQLNSDGKKKIAEIALTRIKPGDVIALDIGSTTLELAKLMAVYCKDIMVFTSSITIAQILAKNENIEVYIVPGIVRKNELSVWGALAHDFINKFHFTIFFMSAAAYQDDIFYEFIIEEAEVKKTFINRSKSTITLIDKTKIGKRSLIEVCNAKQVLEIISDI